MSYRNWVNRATWVVILFIFLACPLWAKDIGTFGTTYQIAENDALQEIEQKAGSVDWGRVANRKELEAKIRNYRPNDLPRLRKARHGRVFTVDLTWALDQDVPDGKGGVLYPKGYRFNPLDYVSYPKTIVVLDGADRNQLGWFAKSGLSKDPKVLLMLTGGKYHDLMQMFRRPVYYANAVVVKRFKLQYIPAVIMQKGNMMEVREIEVKG